MTTTARISYDRDGTPGIWADDHVGAWWGLGWVHGKHRPLQTLLLTAAARGELGARVLPRGDLLQIDAVVRRFDLPERARREEQRLDATTAAWLDAYLDGVRAGLRRSKRPLSLALLGVHIAPPDRTSSLAGLMLSAYLGLAEGQERMERAIVEAVAEGAEPALLERMFAPHLEGWEPLALRRLPRQRPGIGFAGRAVVCIGGSNAWAVSPERSASGHALLAGDPHLQIDQLPALLMETRARIADDYWLGATIPGLPGVAVGRNRSVAWSGTFGVADNIDFTLEELSAEGAVRDGEPLRPVAREVVIRRRLRRPIRLRLLETDRGVLESHGEPGPRLAVRWAAPQKAAEALGAYMRLPFAESVDDAVRVLERAHTLSLHFILADRFGQTRYSQVGCIPRRSNGWSGLYPARATRARWVGLFEPSELPTEGPVDGIVASANEARDGPGGAVLSTLAQPRYRLDRIEQTLRGRRDHDIASMQALQLDEYSLQAERLLPRLAGHVPLALADALRRWDRRYDADSLGAHAFEIAYRTALGALAEELGGSWWTAALARTEVRVWWAAALDRYLAEPGTWSSRSGQRMAAALGAIEMGPRPWGQVQQLRLRHLIFGGLPTGLGLDRGPVPLPGSLATVRQGNLVPAGVGATAVGPAYRFVTDLGVDEAWSALPGGVDGSPRDPSYDRWLEPWCRGEYHRLVPPERDESPEEMQA